MYSRVFTPQQNRARWKRYKEVVKYLKNAIREKYGITCDVKRIKMNNDYYGYCTKISAKKFKIRINRAVGPSYAIETCIHEIAHSLTKWRKNQEDHSDIWGKSYARVYRLYEKQFEKEE